MDAPRHLRDQFVTASGLSVAAFVACALVQGVFLIPGSLETWSVKDPTFVRIVSCLSDGRAVAHFTVAPPVEANLRSHIALWNLAERPPAAALLDLGIAPWRIACSPASHHLFLVTCGGALHYVNLDVAPFQTVYLGYVPHLCPTLVECTADGAFVLVGGMNTATLWDRVAKKRLWMRTDIDIMSAAFAPAGQRLFCGLENGEVLEIDLSSGQTLRRVAIHPSYCTGVVVSPQGKSLGSIDALGHLKLTDLDTGAVVWRKRYAVLLGGKPTVTPVCPRFSPSGRELVLICAARQGQVIVCDAATGRELEASTWVCSDIKGCAVAADGVWYFWDDAGTISAWNRQSSEVWDFSPRVEADARARQRRNPPRDA